MTLTLLALVAIVLLGSFVQGLLGFGSGSICMAFVPLFFPLTDAVPIVASVCLVMNIRLLIQLWPALEFGPLVPLVIGAVLGVPTGVILFKSLNESQLQIALGLVMLLYCGVKLSPLDFFERSLHDRWGLPFGYFGGSLGAAFNVGGPPIIIYLTMKDWDKDQTKATLQAYFLVISMIQVPAFALTGVLTWSHLTPIGLALPSIFLGIWAGSKLYREMGTGQFGRLMFWSLGAIGVFYLTRGLLA